MNFNLSSRWSLRKVDVGAGVDKRTKSMNALFRNCRFHSVFVFANCWMLRGGNNLFDVAYVNV